MTFEALTAGPGSALAAGLIAVAAGTFLARRRRAVRGTTLVAVWRWSCISLAAIALAEVWLGLAGDTLDAGGSAAVRFAAAMTSFCPVMALLGAKRPQDRGWQFIVLSLWVILALPSFEWLLFRRVHEIHPARFWFLAILVLIGALNGIATRYGPSAAMYCLGQVALLAPFSTDTSALRGASGPLLGLTLITAAWGLLATGRPRFANAAIAENRLWRDFRDEYGAVWTLRVAERMNASATAYGWPIALAWSGFRSRDRQQPLEEIPAVALDSLRGLLRRFVSPEWIDARLNPNPCSRDGLVQPIQNPKSKIQNLSP